MKRRNSHAREIVYQARRQIHYDKTVARISQDKRVAFLDSNKDVVFFDVKRPVGTTEKGSSIIAKVQISPYGKANLYVDESLQNSEFEYVTAVLKDLIVDESGSRIELDEIITIASKTRPSPDWLNKTILQLKLPIKVVPKRLQMIFSTMKKQIDNSTRG
jgi:hypothetical protein